MNHTGPACTLAAFQFEPSVPSLLDWQSRSTVPGAAVGVLVGTADGMMTAGLLAVGAAGPVPAGPASIPRVTSGAAIPTAATAATQAAPTRRTWRRCRRRMPSSSPAGGGSAAAAMAARSLRSKSVMVHRAFPGTGVPVACPTGEVAQPRQPVRGLALHGPHAAAEHRRRLGLGEVLEVPQHKDGPLPGGKRREAAQ